MTVPDEHKAAQDDVINRVADLISSASDYVITGKFYAHVLDDEGLLADPEHRAEVARLDGQLAARERRISELEDARNTAEEREQAAERRETQRQDERDAQTRLAAGLAEERDKAWRRAYGLEGERDTALWLHAEAVHFGHGWHDQWISTRTAVHERQARIDAGLAELDRPTPTVAHGANALWTTQNHHQQQVQQVRAALLGNAPIEVAPDLERASDAPSAVGALLGDQPAAPDAYSGAELEHLETMSDRLGGGMPEPEVDRCQSTAAPGTPWDYATGSGAHRSSSMATEINAEALTRAHCAVEDVLIEMRDARMFVVHPANGFVVKEFDGSGSSIMRLGTRDGLRIGIKAYLDAMTELNIPEPAAEEVP